MRLTVITLIALFTTIFISSCSKPFDKKYHKVTEIIDGGTIKVDNGVTVKLIGIEPSDASMEYLEQNLLDQRIRVIYDSEKRERPRSSNDVIYAYLITEKRMGVNGYILKNGLAGLDKTNLNDSLALFTSYSGTYIPGGESGPTGAIEGDELTDLVSKIDPAVFLVVSYSTYAAAGFGTGFFINADGVGVSNHHVFESGNKWSVKTIDGKTHDVSKIIYEDEARDFIIFSVSMKGSKPPFLSIASYTARKGESVIALGNPKGLESTLSKGIVSALHGSYNGNSGTFDDPGDENIQFDAAVSPGSSGGPLMNMRGEVLGITTMKYLDCENCNFALNIKVVREKLKKLRLIP